MSANNLTDSIGCIMLVVAAAGVVTGVTYCSREESQYQLSCRLRWSHVEPTAADSIRVAKLCGNQGLKR